MREHDLKQTPAHVPENPRGVKRETGVHEAVALREWLAVFEESGGRVVREIDKKKEVFGLLKKWHSVFDDRHNTSRNEQFPEAASVFLVSLFGDAKLPTHRWSSLTFAFELSPPPGAWVPDVQGLPGEFVLFDSDLRWTVIVTHEEAEILFSC